jgi:hypothetical protein
MNTYYTLIFFAFILLFLNSSIADRIYSSPYEQYEKSIPGAKLVMIVPIEGDFTGPQYVAPIPYQMPDRKLLFYLSYSIYESREIFLYILF